MSNKIIEFLKVIAEPLGQSIANSGATGQCFLSGYVIANAFKSAGYNSKMVTGHLVLFDKKLRKYVYGSAKYGNRIGVYHTWCQVRINDEEYVVDASLFPNQKVYKAQKINIDKKFEPVMVQLLSKTFPLKYIQDDTMNELPKPHLELTLGDESRKEYFINLENEISQRAKFAYDSLVKIIVEPSEG